MGAGQSNSRLRDAVQHLTTSQEPVPIQDDAFWERLWDAPSNSLELIYSEIDSEALRLLKRSCPKNMATLCRRAVLKLQAATKTDLASPAAKAQVSNAVRILTRLIPFVFEDTAWDGFWWTPTPLGVVVSMPEPAGRSQDAADQEQQEPDDDAPTQPVPLAQTLLDSILFLLFAPGFTVPVVGKSGAVPLRRINAAEYIWAPGVSFHKKLPYTADMDVHRADLIRLMLVCLSRPLYTPPQQLKPQDNRWLIHLASGAHPHAIPLVHSALNLLCGYDPVGMGVPYSQVLMPDDEREALASLCGQLLAVLLDFVPLEEERAPHKPLGAPEREAVANAPASQRQEIVARARTSSDNVMADWASSLSQEKDFQFIVSGISRLLNSPLQAFWMPGSQKRVALHQELMVLFWKLCDLNKAFAAHMLKSSDVLDIVLPILYHANQARLDEAQVGLLHVSVYILLILSGERNFAVRLNKALDLQIKMDIPPFSGTYADLLILVIHSLLTSQNMRITPLYDCLLTIISNVSPYIKAMSLVAANKLVHLFEVFSSPKFLFAAESNHHLVFFLLEAFNNLIQYQFEGNQHLVYVLIRRRKVFYQLEALASATAEPPNSANRIVYAPSQELKPEEDPSTPKKPAPQPVVRTTVADSKDKEHFSVAAEDGASPTTSPIVGQKAKPILQPTPQEDAPAFEPSPEWLLQWHSKLPLETIRRMLHVLVPQVERLCQEKSVTDESDILEFLQHGTLVGLLPVPHPILIRKYQTNPGCSVWFWSYIFGVIYLKNMAPPIWHGSAVRLFRVKVL